MGSPQDDDAEFSQKANSKERFVEQLRVTDFVAKNLKTEIGRLKQSMRENPTLSSKDSDISLKCEVLDAAVSVYIAIKRLLKIRDVINEPRYEHAADGSNEKRDLDQLYDKMTETLQCYETQFNKILQAPDSWFGVQVCRAKCWLEDNPGKASIFAVSAAAATGAGAGAYMYSMGHCWIYYFFTGCSCSSWSLGTSMVAGACGGLVIGAIVVIAFGCYVRSGNHTFENTSKRQAEEVKAVNAMVKAMEKMPNKEVLNLLDTVLDRSRLAMPVVIIDEADRKCLICFGKEQEVQTPVKAPRCRGEHYMCKRCWVRWMAQCGNDNCPTCRI